MRSVSNILAGEFLVDIHRICSESEEEDVSHLQEYLFSGRGLVILKVLGTIGVKVSMRDVKLVPYDRDGIVTSLRYVNY